jgi:hypothetical protein
MKLRGRERLVFVLPGALLFFLSIPALTASADHTLTHGGLYGCDRVIDHEEKGDLEKSTDPPDGSTVQPGQTIHVTITWETDDWDREELHKVLDCVTVDGVLDESLSAGQKPTRNDGVFEHDYTVPAGAPPGTEVCDRAMLTGPDRGEDSEGDFRQDVSNLVCFTVGPPPPPPPAPAPEVLPIREVQEEAPPAPVVLPKVEVRPEALPKSGMDANGLLGLAMACLGLAHIGRRLRATAGD